MAAKKNSSRYQIKVNRDLCISAASCVVLAPKTYKLDNEYKAVVKAKPWDSDELVLAGAKSCPTGAITVIDKKTGKKVWP